MRRIILGNGAAVNSKSRLFGEVHRYVVMPFRRVSGPYLDVKTPMWKAMNAQKAQLQKDEVR